jgi:hypothetical protein
MRSNNVPASLRGFLAGTWAEQSRRDGHSEFWSAATLRPRILHWNTSNAYRAAAAVGRGENRESRRMPLARGRPGDDRDAGFKLDGRFAGASTPIDARAHPNNSERLLTKASRLKNQMFPVQHFGTVS